MDYYKLNTLYAKIVISGASSMKNPRNIIGRFCMKHPNFGIPDLMKYVAIANVVFWLISAVNPVLLSYLTFNPALIPSPAVSSAPTFPSFAKLATKRPWIPKAACTAL